MKIFQTAVLLLIVVFSGLQFVKAQNHPLTYVGIITALNSKVPNQNFKNKIEVIDYIIRQVNLVGVEGELTPDYERLLRQAGATDQLIRAIKVKTSNSSNSTPIGTSAKTYQEMSESEKKEFIKLKTNEFLDKFGRTEADSLPPPAIDSIRSFVEGYLRRLSIDDKAISSGNGEQMVSKNSCPYGRGNLANVLKRGGLHSPNIIDSFTNKGLQPEIGIYIAFLESEFCPCIQSPTGPLGMFQLTFATASTFGIKAVRGASPESPDERCNPKAAALGAASFLKMMSEKHYGKDINGVLFMIAGFNSGDGFLNRNIKTVRELNSGKGKVTFWDLVENADKLTQQFQTENVKYVPKFLASAIIGENPKEFGLVEFEPLSGRQTPNINKPSEVDNELDYWQKQYEKALEPRNKPTGENPAGLIIPNELSGSAPKQKTALDEMKSQGFVAPMDYFDLAKRSVSNEFVELPLVTETYLLEVGGSATNEEFTKFGFEETTTPSPESPEYKSLETFANSFSQKYDLNNPLDRKKIKIRLLRMLDPKAKTILEEIAQKYHDKFKRPLRVTALIRSMEYQVSLNKTNANSFLVRGEGSLPPHCAGVAFDLAYKQMTAEEQNFVLGIVAEMERKGRVDGIREGGANSAIHVFAL